MFLICINNLSVTFGIFHRVDLVIWLMTSNCSLRRSWYGCVSVFVEAFVYLSIFVIILKELFSWWIFLMNNGLLKGKFSNFLSFCLNNSLNNLLLGKQSGQSYTRYVIDEVVSIWYDMVWYCWLVFLWMFWNWFGPLWWWKVLPKYSILSLWSTDRSYQIFFYFREYSYFKEKWHNDTKNRY